MLSRLSSKYCKNGHERNDTNSYTQLSTGRRVCRICNNKHKMAYYRRMNPIIKRSKSIKHGTDNGYSNYGCRCEPCKLAMKKYRQKIYNSKPDSFADRSLRRRYGVSLEERHIMFENQGHKCAICGKQEEYGKNMFSIDHNHKNGEVRGILCHCCNMGIGYFQDSIEYLEEAIKYLKKEVV